MAILNSDSRVSDKKKTNLTQAQKMDGDNKIFSFIEKVNNNFAKIIISVLVLIVFIYVNFIADTLGSLSRNLLSDKYWYNKQIIIFLTIYVGINLTSLHGLHVEPQITILYSIIGWLLFNILTSLGEVWFYKKYSITWFLLVMIPMILFYIVYDFKTYYSDLEPNAYNTKIINILKILETILLFLFIVLLITGFTISYTRQKNKLKSKFNFLKFFFLIKS